MFVNMLLDGTLELGLKMYRYLELLDQDMWWNERAVHAHSVQCFGNIETHKDK